ncbi:MAG: DNA methyltransferase [Terriglobales bacterium]
MSGLEKKFGTAERRWAGVGPYYAMFPSAFCDSVVERYTRPGDTVLDPFAGRGTAVFSAAVADRHGIGVELNPVGWVYSRTKLNPEDRDQVEKRIRSVRDTSPRYRAAARELPIFFRHCFSREVREFLLCAREILNWRRSGVDRTAMAFILIHLHGKVSDSLSNQMRQTKAMAPRYAVKWWKERDLKPPNIDPLEFFKKKLDWRYSKGAPRCQTSKVYLGDSTLVLPALQADLSRRKLGRASLLLTSPPYFGITNYHYDQWIRLWLLGGPPTDRRVGTRYSGKHRDKFAHAEVYRCLLETVFKSAARLMKKDACIYVRTDWREPTLSITRTTLKAAFPSHEFKRVNRPLIGETQTRLFGHYDPRFGEVDLVLRLR